MEVRLYLFLNLLRNRMRVIRSGELSLESLKVVKRSGGSEAFKLDKLTKSVHLAMNSAGFSDPSHTAAVIDEVINEILKNPEGLTTAKIADLVEKTLISKVITDPRYELAARHYVLARIYNDVFSKEGWSEFNPEDSKMSYYSLRVLASRYLMKNPSNGRFLETPKALFERVAKHISSAETRDRERWLREFYRLLSELKFVPNSPTLMNAGTKLGILSACFVLPVRDSMVTPEGEGIYDTVRAQAIVFQQGGGTGFSFSELRPEGDVVSSTASVASGPLSFMRLFDVNTDVVKQGGRRRGANMGVLHVWHPDIMKFIKSKSGELKDKSLQNFNISVGMYDWFFKNMAEGRPVPLINPRKTSVDGSSDSRKYAVVWARHYMDEEWVQEAIVDELEARGGSIPLDESVIITWDEALAIAERENAVVGWEDPKAIFQEIVKNAWDSGDPGLLFIDTVNRRHPTWYVGKINATNPCVTGDTRILTKKGYVRIGDLVKAGIEEEELVLPAEAHVVYVARDGRAEVVSVSKPVVIRSKVFSQGIKPVYRVKTVEGYELKATPDHKLIVASRGECFDCTKPSEHIVRTALKSLVERNSRHYNIVWKRVDQLRPGDRIILGRTTIDELSDEFGDVSIGGDMAFLLGWLVGSGHIKIDDDSEYVSWRFSADKEGLAQEVVEILRSRFPDVSVQTYRRKNEIRIVSKSKHVFLHLAKLAPELVNKRSAELVMPETVYRLKPREIAWFLKGLFTANGSLDRTTVRLTLKSLKLLKQVQELLLLFGITSRICENVNDGNNVSKDLPELVLMGYSREVFVEKIGFADVNKVSIGSFKKLKVDPPLATVASVEYLGEEEVFDTAVPGYHYYVAGGFISHNCGEEPLLEWESCNLGSINLERYVIYADGKPTIDWVGLGADVRTATRFLDNVIDVAKWPLPQLEWATRRTRKVGLGVMGWAHMLIKLGIPYDSVDALYLAYYLSEWIAYNAYRASVELAKEKGPFPAWNPKLYRPFWITAKPFDEVLRIAGIESRVSDSVRMMVESRPAVDWTSLREEMMKYGLRNATLLSIAPTGTISIIADTSSSIEPVFALAFTRMVTVGTFVEVNNLFLNSLREYGLDNPEVINMIAESGSVRHNPYIPKRLREIFVTAHDVEPTWHVLHQAAWQQWVDAGVSKTVNMRAEASVDDVRNVYMLAYKLGCKGITVYRDKSKSQQVIYFGAKLTRRMARERRMEGVVEPAEASRKGGETGEEEPKPSEPLSEAERKPQVRYRMPSRYTLQEGEAGDCYTCGY